jgi:magnesium-transporting ATPase (P-type)
LLWLNLVATGIQIVFLGLEKGEPGLLDRPPREADAPVFDRRMIEQVAIAGVTIGGIGFVFYYAALSSGWEQAAARGAVLWLLVWCMNAQTLNSRSETRSLFRIPLANNPLLIVSVIGMQLLQLAVLAVPPLRDLLSMDRLTASDGMQLALGAVIVLAAIEVYKLVRPPPPVAPKRAGRMRQAGG